MYGILNVIWKNNIYNKSMILKYNKIYNSFLNIMKYNLNTILQNSIKIKSYISLKL